MASLIVPGLAVQGLFSDIPHDAAAIVAYVVLALFVGFVMIGGRRKHDAAPPSEGPSATAASPAPPADEAANP